MQRLGCAAASISLRNCLQKYINSIYFKDKILGECINSPYFCTKT